MNTRKHTIENTTAEPKYKRTATVKATPEKIINLEFENGRYIYQIKWRGGEVTWEPFEHFSDCEELIADFKKRKMTVLTGNRTAFIYCRVSSKEQSVFSAGHTSLEVQRAECEKFCREYGLTVAREFSDTGSGKKMDKLKGFNELVSMAPNDTTIVFYDISRFSRNCLQALTHLANFEARNIKVVSVKDMITYSSAWEKNQFRLALCSSEHYSDICSEKVKASIAFRKERGDYMGKAPFGFKKVRNLSTGCVELQEDFEEQKTIKLIEDCWTNTHADDCGIELRDKRHFELFMKTISDKGLKNRGKDFTLKAVKKFLEL